MNVYDRLEELGIKLLDPTPKRRDLQSGKALWGPSSLCIGHSAPQCGG